MTEVSQHFNLKYKHFICFHTNYLQVAAVREGMSWIIPVPLLSLVTPGHLEHLVCGLPEVSVDVLKKVVR